MRLAACPEFSFHIKPVQSLARLTAHFAPSAIGTNLLDYLHHTSSVSTIRSNLVSFALANSTNPNPRKILHLPDTLCQ